ncbi:helix-turn-helix transcriptional regulator [Methylobacterium sp. P31]
MISGTNMTQKQFLTGREIDARYGISSMTRWRWLHDERLGFPRPTLINRRHFFAVEDIERWEQERTKLRLRTA